MLTTQGGVQSWELQIKISLNYLLRVIICIDSYITQGRQIRTKYYFIMA